MSVLIIGAILGAGVIADLSSSLHVYERTNVVWAGSSARALADACAEKALLEIRNAGDYFGSQQISFSYGDCTYTVTNDDDEQSTVLSTGEVDNTLRKATLIVSKLTQVDQNGTTTEITDIDWQEVVDF